uniref:Radical S-adenosyl methionine domain containing 1 n=1 Tax=Otus sunia TaxID=257818 RepID=A0A8C8AJL6_9STRI
MRGHKWDPGACRRGGACRTPGLARIGGTSQPRTSWGTRGGALACTCGGCCEGLHVKWGHPWDMRLVALGQVGTAGARAWGWGYVSLPKVGCPPPSPPAPRARSGPTAASAAPTATSTSTWCRRWTRRPCAPAWCGRHAPCSASARCRGGCVGGGVCGGHGAPQCLSTASPPSALQRHLCLLRRGHPQPGQPPHHCGGAGGRGGGCPPPRRRRGHAGGEPPLRRHSAPRRLQGGRCQPPLRRHPGERGSAPSRPPQPPAPPAATALPLQSLDDAELRLLGREHTAAEARGAVEAARGLFPGRTSIDLLFGLPGQSRGAWARGLEAALGLCDHHVSLYQLTLERGTALAAQVSGGALPAPSQDLLADMYQTARAALVAAGFRQYEVSNFARKGTLSTHNLSYWRAEQYIGVGPGAHGRFVLRGEGGRSREARVQTLEPDAWMREVQSRGHGTRRRVVLSPLEQLEEVLALGLRTDEGVTHERWGRFSPHLSLEAIFGAPGEAKALQQQGWLVLDGGGLRCTWRGLALLDSLLPALLCQLQRRWAPPAAPALPAQGAAPAGGGGAPRRSP